MKNSKQYSKKIQSLYRQLKHKYPNVPKVIYDEPVDAVVFGIISENLSVMDAQSGYKRIMAYFVDLNDLRVSLTDEVVEVIGSDNPQTRQIAVDLGSVLRSVFDKYNVISLAALKKQGKRPAKQAIGKLEGISRFVVDYCMLTAMDGHAIPLTERMVDYLQIKEFVDADADVDAIEGFLVRQISARNGYEFYWLVRRESESVKLKKRVKVKKKQEVKKPKKKAKKSAKKTKKKKVKKASKRKNRKTDKKAVKNTKKSKIVKAKK